MFVCLFLGRSCVCLFVPGKELCLFVCLEVALRAVEAPNRGHIGGSFSCSL